MPTQTLKFSGLTCPACKKIIEKRVSGIDGVKSIEVNLDSGIAMIDADQEINILAVKAVLLDTPYQVVNQ